MTRQGSMGESFGKLYEGDKIAKQESIRRNMARLHRIDKTGKGRTAAGRYASSMGASRSPRRGGEPQLIPEYNDDGSESEGTADSDMEVVYDRFGESLGSASLTDTPLTFLYHCRAQRLRLCQLKQRDLPLLGFVDADRRVCLLHLLEGSFASPLLSSLPRLSPHLGLFSP